MKKLYLVNTIAVFMYIPANDPIFNLGIPISIVSVEKRVYTCFWKLAYQMPPYPEEP